MALSTDKQKRVSVKKCAIHMKVIKEKPRETKKINMSLVHLNHVVMHPIAQPYCIYKSLGRMNMKLSKKVNM